MIMIHSPPPPPFPLSKPNKKKPAARFLAGPIRSHPRLRHVSLPVGPTTKGAGAGESADSDEVLTPASAAAVAAAIRRVSKSSAVEFTTEKKKSGILLPSPDFQRLCTQQLDLFRMVVHRDALLSVFVRPAGSYVMDQLELRRVAFYPGVDIPENAECIILVGNFAMAAGLHAAEAALSKLQLEFIREYGAVVLPMVKHPFVVGFLVAELPKIAVEEACDVSSVKNVPPRLPTCSDELLGIQAFKEESNWDFTQFTMEQRSRAIMISHSLAMAYVMDQKAMLLQQSSWQNNVRMSHLVEQIRGSLSSIRALGKMLSVHVKRSEISHDITEDILMQSAHMKDALQQLQDAVYLTKANIVQYHDDTLRRMHDSIYNHQAPQRSSLPDYSFREPEENSQQIVDSLLPLVSGTNDTEMPMPPLLLTPLQEHNIRPCIVSDVLKDLIGAAVPLASNQRRSLQLHEVAPSLQVAVEESALRQALSNLVEGAILRTHTDGRVDIYATEAPAGGALVVIDDNGPDMHYMTQMHALMPFRADLAADRVEDNMTWNFVAGLAVAREILENYGCVIRVISPRDPDAPLGAGGTRLELWLPSLQTDLLSTGLDA